MVIKLDSVWKNNVLVPSFPQLNKDAETDVLIIGGGMAGLLTAFMLHKAGVQYLLIEQNKIVNGITSGTTAKSLYSDRV